MARPVRVFVCLFGVVWGRLVALTSDFRLWELDPATGQRSEIPCHGAIRCPSGCTAHGLHGASVELPSELGSLIAFLFRCSCIEGDVEVFSPPTVAVIDVEAQVLRELAFTSRSTFSFEGLSDYFIAYDGSRGRIVVAGSSGTGLPGVWRTLFVSIDPQSGKVDDEVFPGPSWTLRHSGFAPLPGVAVMRGSVWISEYRPAVAGPLRLMGTDLAGGESGLNSTSGLELYQLSASGVGTEDLAVLLGVGRCCGPEAWCPTACDTDDILLVRWDAGWPDPGPRILRRIGRQDIGWGRPSHIGATSRDGQRHTALVAAAPTERGFCGSLVTFDGESGSLLHIAKVDEHLPEPLFLHYISATLQDQGHETNKSQFV